MTNANINLNKEIKVAKRGVKRTIMVLDSETIGFDIHKGSRLLAVRHNKETGKIDTKFFSPFLKGGFVNITPKMKNEFEKELLEKTGITIIFDGFGGMFEIQHKESYDENGNIKFEDGMTFLGQVEEFFTKKGWNVSKKDNLSVWKKDESKEFKARQKAYKKQIVEELAKDGFTPNYEKLAYDIGYTVTRYNAKTRKMEVLRERSYIVKEVFMNMQIMEKAYFFSKHATYMEMLSEGEIKMKPFQEILDIMEQDVAEFGINTFSNYNAGFDTQVMVDTARILNCETPKNFKVMLDDVWCIWNMACQILYKRPSYVQTALENGWISDSGKYLTTNAEVGYRYMTKDYDFIEDHTALSDARIETELLGYILKQGKKVDKSIKATCWRSAKITNYCTVEQLAIERLSKDEIKNILKKNKVEEVEETK